MVRRSHVDGHKFLCLERAELLGLNLSENNLGWVKSISSLGQLWMKHLLHDY